MPDTVLLRTARLTLRRFTDADVDDLAALHGDPAVLRYIGAPVPRAVTERELLPGILAGYAELPAGFGCFAATDGDGGFLGWFALHPADSAALTGPGTAGGIELGYRLRTAAWGRGYATEGGRALAATAFGDLGVERLVATTMAVNTGSRRVLAKIGFSHERTVFPHWDDPLPGAEHGDVVYTMDSPFRTDAAGSR